jgi:thiamine biosynthesis lipoprotein
MSEPTSRVGSWSARSFRAMGSVCRVVTPDEGLTRHAVDLVDELERTWSRFLPDSEVSAVNDAAGRLTIVSPHTYELISHAERARRATGGTFHPLMLDQLVALGYDRTWSQIERHVDSDPEGEPDTASGSDLGIELFPDVRGVRIPDGTRFDPGGIGKGLAGDLVAAALVEAGATTLQIELGGDVRVVGPSWTGGPWVVGVDDSDHGVPGAATVSLAEGGVATSSVLRRRWRRADVVHHHLLDPATGRSAVTDLDSVTAVASTLWWAEVVAKVALIAGSAGARRVMNEWGASGLLVGAGAPPRYEVVTGSADAA